MPTKFDIKMCLETGLIWFTPKMKPALYTIICFLYTPSIIYSSGLQCFECMDSSGCGEPFVRNGSGVDIVNCTETVSCLKVKATAGPTVGKGSTGVRTNRIYDGVEAKTRKFQACFQII